MTTIACAGLARRERASRFDARMTGRGKIELDLLGPLRARIDGVPTDIRAPLERALVARLALDNGHRVSTDELVATLWGEVPPPTARATLHAYVSRLRRRLGSATIARDGDGYLLAGVALDTDRFDAFIDAANREPDRPARARLLDEALGLWRGDPFAELPDVIEALGRRAALEERRVLAWEQTIAARLADPATDPSTLVPELDRMQVLWPMRERVTELRMTALYRTGRQAEALAAYRALRDRLVDELGLEPGPDVRRLEQRILTHDPLLADPGTALPHVRLSTPAADELLTTSRANLYRISMPSVATGADSAGGIDANDPRTARVVMVWAQYMIQAGHLDEALRRTMECAAVARTHGDTRLLAETGAQIARLAELIAAEATTAP